VICLALHNPALHTKTVTTWFGHICTTPHEMHMGPLIFAFWAVPSCKTPHPHNPSERFAFGWTTNFRICTYSRHLRRCAHLWRCAHLLSNLHLQGASTATRPVWRWTFIFTGIHGANGEPVPPSLRAEPEEVISHPVTNHSDCEQVAVNPEWRLLKRRHKISRQWWELVSLHCLSLYATIWKKPSWWLATLCM